MNTKTLFGRLTLLLSHVNVNHTNLRDIQFPKNSINKREEIEGEIKSITVLPIPME